MRFVRKHELVNRLATTADELNSKDGVIRELEAEGAALRLENARLHERANLLEARLDEIRAELAQAKEDLRRWVGLDEHPLERTSLSEDDEIRKAREARVNEVLEQLDQRGIELL